MALLFWAVSAQAAVEHHVFAALGGQTIYQGYNLHVVIDAQWMDCYAMSVDPATDRVTAPGGAFTADTPLRFVTDGQLPVPLIMTLHEGAYKAASVSGDSFQLKNAWTSQIADLMDAGTGTNKVCRAAPIVASNHMWIKRVTGLPAGVTYTLKLTNGADVAIDGTCHGEGYACPSQYAGYGAPIRFDFAASASAALGPASVLVTLQAGETPEKTVSIPITVVPEPATPALSPASVIAPLPSKALWENQLKVVASRNCVNPNFPFAFGDWTTFSMGPIGSWYYDGSWAYFQMAEYLQEPQWNACGLNIARQYRDAWINANPRPNAYSNFIQGLDRAYDLTRDPRYVQAMQMAGGYVFSDISEMAMREAAYMLDSTLVLHRRTPNHMAALVTQADVLLGMFDNFANDRPQTQQQIFMDGLAMKALIEYWKVTRDPRVPVTIKLMLDWIWTHAWDDTRKLMMYNPATVDSRHCWSGGCQSVDDGRSLTMLVAPAYAWYWAFSGDDTYRVRGDSMFESSIGVLSYEVTPGSPARFRIAGHSFHNGDEVMIADPCLDMGGTPCSSTIPPSLWPNLLSLNAYTVQNISGDTFSLRMGSNDISVTGPGYGLLNGGMMLLCDGPCSNGYQNYIVYHGKQWGQNYRWGFDYVKWRTDPASITAPSVLPLSSYASAVSPAALQPHVYPNPWRQDRHAGGITFDNLSAGTTIKIFTISGHLVRELMMPGASVSWDRKNDKGDFVASGIYIYLVQDAQGNQAKGKLGIVK